MIMKSKTVVIIGHKEIYNSDKAEIMSGIKGLIEQGYTTFLCGGMGQFDNLCAKYIWLLKKTYPSIKSYLVIPYLNFNISNIEYYDEIIYPNGLEKCHYKAVIGQRNKYMVDKSSIAFCYICYNFGGAIKTYNYAKKQGLTIINTGTIDK